MNLDEFATLAKIRPPTSSPSIDFLADLPAGRSLEGYLYPDTYRVDAERHRARRCSRSCSTPSGSG